VAARLVPLLRLPSARGRPSLLHVHLRLQGLLHRQDDAVVKRVTASRLPPFSSLSPFSPLGGGTERPKGKRPRTELFASRPCLGGFAARGERGGQGKRVGQGCLLLLCLSGEEAQRGAEDQDVRDSPMANPWFCGLATMWATLTCGHLGVRASGAARSSHSGARACKGGAERHCAA
jgi:hypothetical protein